jgi:hypothetical protein
MSQHDDAEAAREAMIEAEVAEALQPYRTLYPPEVLEEAEHMMRIVLRTHPAAKHLVEQLLPRPVLEESDKVDVRAFNGARARAKKVGGP